MFVARPMMNGTLEGTVGFGSPFTTMITSGARWGPRYSQIAVGNQIGNHTHTAKSDSYHKSLVACLAGGFYDLVITYLIKSLCHPETSLD